MKQPKCRNCGKLLRPRRRWHNPNPKTMEEARAAATQYAPWQKAKIEDLSELYKRPEFRVTFYAGFGNYADNVFCGLNCGYQWAVRRIA